MWVRVRNQAINLDRVTRFKLDMNTVSLFFDKSCLVLRNYAGAVDYGDEDIRLSEVDFKKVKAFFEARLGGMRVVHSITVSKQRLIKAAPVGWSPMLGVPKGDYPTPSIPVARLTGGRDE